MKKKIFVLDTNVILHDSSCLKSFEEHDVIIPITVIEELDQFKKGNSEKNFHAREFSRTLDEMNGKKLFDGGVSLGDNKGFVRIELNKPYHKEIQDQFPEDEPDHRIINNAYILKNKHPKNEVILVSKDFNLRLKARAIGLVAEDYTKDKVDINDLSTDYKTYIISVEEINSLQKNGKLPKINSLNMRANEFVIFAIDNHKSVLAMYDPINKEIQLVSRKKTSGIIAKNDEQIFATHALLNTASTLVSLSGKAGTGKTLLALACALEQRDKYQSILLTRPTIALSNSDMGFLPGNINSKLAPYMQPLYDNLSFIKSRHDVKGSEIERLKQSKKLVIEPLAYIRGRTLHEAFLIVDESQNLTPHEVKTIITRAGRGTKMVFTGDIHQIDHPYLDSQSNGLSYLIQRMQGQEFYSHTTLKKGERSPLAEAASNLL